MNLNFNDFFRILSYSIEFIQIIDNQLNGYRDSRSEIFLENFLNIYHYKNREYIFNIFIFNFELFI